jgi:hypothetical protein
MKEFIAALTLSLAATIGGFLLIALAFSKAAHAEEVEPPKEPVIVQDFVQCTYKPSPSDEVRYFCGTIKEGEGHVNIWICGSLYKVAFKCPHEIVK